jgi:hypothetical protein
VSVYYFKAKAKNVAVATVAGLLQRAPVQIILKALQVSFPVRNAAVADFLMVKVKNVVVIIAAEHLLQVPALIIMLQFPVEIKEVV